MYRNNQSLGDIIVTMEFAVFMIVMNNYKLLPTKTSLIIIFSGIVISMVCHREVRLYMHTVYVCLSYSSIFTCNLALTTWYGNVVITAMTFEVAAIDKYITVL